MKGYQSKSQSAILNQEKGKNYDVHEKLICKSQGQKWTKSKIVKTYKHLRLIQAFYATFLS